MYNKCGPLDSVSFNPIPYERYTPNTIARIWYNNCRNGKIIRLIVRTLRNLPFASATNDLVSEDENFFSLFHHPFCALGDRKRELMVYSKTVPSEPKQKNGIRIQLVIGVMAMVIKQPPRGLFTEPLSTYTS